MIPIRYMALYGCQNCIFFLAGEQVSEAKMEERKKHCRHAFFFFSRLIGTGKSFVRADSLSPVPIYSHYLLVCLCQTDSIFRFNPLGVLSELAVAFQLCQKERCRRKSKENKEKGKLFTSAALLL